MSPEKSGVAIRNNTLYLDGARLNAKTHSYRDISYVLGALGKSAIVEDIEQTYVERTKKYPGGLNVRPYVRVMNLGMGIEDALTKYGLCNRSHIHKSIIEIQTKFHEHWRTIIWNGFSPEVHSGMGHRTLGTNWLMLRNPETDPPVVTLLDALPAALGFRLPSLALSLKPKLADALQRYDDEQYTRLYDCLYQACQISVDRQTDTYGYEARAPAQIGMMIALANLGVELEGNEYIMNDDGYINHLKDASDYAYDMEMDEVDALLRLEIDRIEIQKMTSLDNE